jgi:hypothetical protein
VIGEIIKRGRLREIRERRGESAAEAKRLSRKSRLSRKILRRKRALSMFEMRVCVRGLKPVPRERNVPLNFSLTFIAAAEVYSQR